MSIPQKARRLRHKKVFGASSLIFPFLLVYATEQDVSAAIAGMDTYRLQMDVVLLDLSSSQIMEMIAAVKSMTNAITHGMLLHVL
jgi:hypothetical protein